MHQIGYVIPHRRQQSFRGLVLVAIGDDSHRSLRALLAGLPLWFPMPLVIVQDCDPGSEHVLVEAVHRSGTVVPVRKAADGDALQPGVVYVASACRYTAVVPSGLLRVSKDTEHSGAPAAEGLFSSTAALVPARSAAVVLSGAGSWADDAAAPIKRAGGLVIAEDPDGKVVKRVSRLTTLRGSADYVLPVREIAPLLTALLVD